MDTFRIIIIEDELLVAMDIENRLTKAGHTVLAIESNGEDAIKSTLKLKPDLVLMDIILSGEMDGVQAASKIKQSLDIPIIYLTAHSDNETLQRAQVTEPFGYIIKPISTRDLVATIEMSMYRYAAEKKNRWQLKRLNAIRVIDQAIITNQDLPHTLDEVAQQVSQLLGVDGVAVLLANPSGEVLDYIAFQGLLIKAPKARRDGFASQVVRDEKKLFIPRLDKEGAPECPHWMSELGIVSYIGMPLICQKRVQGVLEVFHCKELKPEPEWLDFLESLAAQAAIAVDNASMLGELKAMNQNLVRAYDSTIEGWSRALELRDLETEGHSRRVTGAALRLARYMGIDEVQQEHIRRGALLHDIGKMGIPDHILLKPGGLTPEEWETMRKHPVYAYQLLSSVPFLKPALDIPFYHHEKWDGSGYPEGLKGEQIPLPARIFAVVDVWDALCSNRPYQTAWDETEVLEYLRKEAGKQFDPHVVECFLKMRADERRNAPPKVEGDHI